jgi:Na+/melibiose symporter-like transporter
MVNVPFSAQTAVMTLDPVMRGKIASVRVSGTFFAMIILSFCTLRIVNWAQRTMGSEAKGFQLAAIIFSTLAIPFLVWCFFSNKEVVKIEPQKMKYKDMYVCLRDNKPFWILVFMSLCWGVQGAGGAFKAYYFRYNIGNFMALANDMTLGGIAGFLGCLSVSFWVTKFEKHKILQTGFLCAAVCSIVNFFTPVATTSWGIYMYYGVDVFAGYFMGLMLATQFGIFPDVTEYTRYYHGIYASGFLSSFINFAYKFGAAIMTASAGWILAAVGYAANQTQSAFTLGAIRSHHLFIAFFQIIAAIVMSQYKLDRKTYGELVDKLERGEYAPGVNTSAK